MTLQAWAQWHVEHERRLADPHGFLAITSLNFLTATPQRFPDAPGHATSPSAPPSRAWSTCTSRPGGSSSRWAGHRSR
jgi:hypothetical protein